MSAGPADTLNRGAARRPCARCVLSALVGLIAVGAMLVVTVKAVAAASGRGAAPAGR